MKELNVRQAVSALKNAELVVVPTDTVYGIAADPTNEEALEKLYNVKGRAFDKPILLLVADNTMLEKIVGETTPRAKNLIKGFWPGALTIVFKKNASVSDKLTAGLSTVGVRMPNSDVMLEILQAFKAPLAVTSANMSGEKAAVNPEEAQRTVDENMCAGFVNGGVCQQAVASTIVDMSDDTAKILRQGTVTQKEINVCLEAWNRNDG